jgi:hypothetical protein
MQEVATRPRGHGAVRHGDVRRTRHDGTDPGRAGRTSHRHSYRHSDRHSHRRRPRQVAAPSGSHPNRSSAIAATRPPRQAARTRAAARPLIARTRSYREHGVKSVLDHDDRRSRRVARPRAARTEPCRAVEVGRRLSSTKSPGSARARPRWRVAAARRGDSPSGARRAGEARDRATPGLAPASVRRPSRSFPNAIVGDPVEDDPSPDPGATRPVPR